MTAWGQVRTFDLDEEMMNTDEGITDDDKCIPTYIET